MPDLHPATAAYLYILSLDGPGRAWEYLRRNPVYQRSWALRSAAGDSEATSWGLRFP